MGPCNGKWDRLCSRQSSLGKYVQVATTPLVCQGLPQVELLLPAMRVWAPLLWGDGGYASEIENTLVFYQYYDKPSRATYGKVPPRVLSVCRAGHNQTEDQKGGSCTL